MTREEAIKEIKSWDFLEGKEIEAIQTLVPELAESEDERIRKELIEFIQWSVDRRFMREDFHQAKRPSEWIAWLEKQKEQKPTSISCGHENDAEWGQEDEEMRNALWNLLKIQYPQDYYMTGAGIKAGKFRDWLKSLRPSWKPSKEQLLQLRCAICGCSYDIEPLVSLEEQLKQL